MQSPYRKNPTLLPDDQNEADFQNLIDSITRSRTTPSKVYTTQLAERLIQGTHKISRATITHDKEQISLSTFVPLANFSEMT